MRRRYVDGSQEDLGVSCIGACCEIALLWLAGRRRKFLQHVNRSADLSARMIVKKMQLLTHT